VARRDDTLFLAHFLLHLSVRDHLVAKDNKIAAEMAKHADTCCDAMVSDSSVTAVAAAKRQPPLFA
jgi:hypothetical protein